MNTKKVTKSILASLIVFNVVGFTSEEVYAASNDSNKIENSKLTTELTQEEMNAIFLKAIDESAHLFKDPSVAEDLKEGLMGVQKEGKATIAAKAAGSSIKALVKRVGQKGWDSMINKLEDSTGASLVILHYKSINKFVDFLTSFQGDIEDGITSYLTRNGFNSYFARLIAKAFILIVL